MVDLRCWTFNHKYQGRDKSGQKWTAPFGDHFPERRIFSSLVFLSGIPAAPVPNNRGSNGAGGRRGTVLHRRPCRAAGLLHLSDCGYSSCIEFKPSRFRRFGSSYSGCRDQERHSRLAAFHDNRAYRSRFADASRGAFPRPSTRTTEVAHQPQESSIYDQHHPENTRPQSDH